jgi:hypothetical protein
VDGFGDRAVVCRVEKLEDLADATAGPVVPARQIEHPQRSDGRRRAEPDTETWIVGECCVPDEIERIAGDLVVRGVPSAGGMHNGSDQTCGHDGTAFEQAQIVCGHGADGVGVVAHLVPGVLDPSLGDDVSCGGDDDASRVEPSSDGTLLLDATCECTCAPTVTPRAR